MQIRQRLRTKLITAFSIITLLPALLVGSYAIYIVTITLTQHALATQSEQAKTLKYGIESFLNGVQRDLFFLTESVNLKDYLQFAASMGDFSSVEQQELEKILIQKRNKVEQEFLNFSNSKNIYYQICYLNEKGKEIIKIDTNNRKNRILSQDRLQNKVDQQYFINTINLPTHQVFVSPIALNRERNVLEVPYNPLINYAKKVRDATHREMGIIVLTVDADKFLAPLNNTRLVTDEGFFINHPDNSKVWGSETDLNTGHNLAKEYGTWAEHLLNKTGLLNNGNLTIASERVVVPSSEQYWTLIVQSNTSDVLKGVAVFKLTFIVILLLSLAAALGAAFVFSIKITRPIEQLTQLADRISKGEMVEIPVNIRNQDEIGQLAQAFERMRVSMLKSFARLRKQSTN